MLAKVPRDYRGTSPSSTSTFQQRSEAAVGGGAEHADSLNFGVEGTGMDRFESGIAPFNQVWNECVHDSYSSPETAAMQAPMATATLPLPAAAVSTFQGLHPRGGMASAPCGTDFGIDHNPGGPQANSIEPAPAQEEGPTRLLPKSMQVLATPVRLSPTTVPRQKGTDGKVLRYEGACPRCARDVIFNGKNDGVHCTRCFNTLEKEQKHQVSKVAMKMAQPAIMPASMLGDVALASTPPAPRTFAAHRQAGVHGFSMSYPANTDSFGLAPDAPPTTNPGMSAYALQHRTTSHTQPSAATAPTVPTVMGVGNMPQPPFRS